MEALAAEIIAIGNEVLNGEIVTAKTLLDLLQRVDA